ncbi:MAG: hypothetical protein HC822_17710 [Oscillochloris sp.]|nr:hypothetical protein [Oscillochloris sp.]
MWPRIANMLIGTWLMFAPWVLGYEDGLAGANHRIVGPLVLSFSGIAIAQVMRPTRWANVPLGLWLMMAPLLMGYGDVAYFNGVVAGIAIVGFSVIKGKIDSKFGGGWANIWRDNGFPPEQPQSN